MAMALYPIVIILPYHYDRTILDSFLSMKKPISMYVSGFVPIPMPVLMRVGVYMAFSYIRINITHALGFLELNCLISLLETTYRNYVWRVSGTQRAELARLNVVFIF